MCVYIYTHTRHTNRRHQQCLQPFHHRNIHKYIRLHIHDTHKKKPMPATPAAFHFLKYAHKYKYIHVHTRDINTHKTSHVKRAVPAAFTSLKNILKYVHTHTPRRHKCVPAALPSLIQFAISSGEDCFPTYTPASSEFRIILNLYVPLALSITTKPLPAPFVSTLPSHMGSELSRTAMFAPSLWQMVLPLTVTYRHVCVYVLHTCEVTPLCPLE